MGEPHARPPGHRAVRRPWLIDPKAARTGHREIMDAYDVRAPGPDTSAGALSGGNQQKLVVGREIESEPRLLVAAHPTRGVDVGAQALIWELRRARDRGMGTLLISADLDELIGLSDTMLVLLRGRIVATLDPATLTPEVLGAHMTGAHDGARCGVTALSRLGRALVAPAVAVVLALLVSGLVVGALGLNPLTALAALFDFGAVRAGAGQPIRMLVNGTVPLFLSGLAVSVAFRMDLFNIGVEGQYRIAMVVAAGVGAPSPCRRRSTHGHHPRRHGRSAAPTRRSPRSSR